jgi:hypothetical protein
MRVRLTQLDGALPNLALLRLASLDEIHVTRHAEPFDMWDPPRKVMAYMLIGYDPKETWERIWHRFHRMVERGVKPYPMVYDRARKDLCAFQRWVNLGLYRIVPWKDYTGKLGTDRDGRHREHQLDQA